MIEICQLEIGDLFIYENKLYELVLKQRLSAKGRRLYTINDNEYKLFSVHTKVYI